MSEADETTNIKQVSDLASNFAFGNVIRFIQFRSVNLVIPLRFK